MQNLTATGLGRQLIIIGNISGGKVGVSAEASPPPSPPVNETLRALVILILVGHSESPGRDCFINEVRLPDMAALGILYCHQPRSPVLFIIITTSGSGGLLNQQPVYMPILHAHAAANPIIASTVRVWSGRERNWVPIFMGAYFHMGTGCLYSLRAYQNGNGSLFSWGAYIQGVPIIPILWQTSPNM